MNNSITPYTETVLPRVKQGCISGSQEAWFITISHIFNFLAERTIESSGLPGVVMHVLKPNARIEKFDLSRCEMSVDYGGGNLRLGDAIDLMLAFDWPEEREWLVFLDHDVSWDPGAARIMFDTMRNVAQQTGASVVLPVLAETRKPGVCPMILIRSDADAPKICGWAAVRDQKGRPLSETGERWIKTLSESGRESELTLMPVGNLPGVHISSLWIRYSRNNSLDNTLLDRPGAELARNMRAGRFSPSEDELQVMRDNFPLFDIYLRS